MRAGIIDKNNQSREESNLCWVWSKDEVPFPSENQVNNANPEPAVQSSVTSTAQLGTCSSTHSQGMGWGSSQPLPCHLPSDNISQASHPHWQICPLMCMVLFCHEAQNLIFWLFGKMPLSCECSWAQDRSRAIPWGLMLTDRYLPILKRSRYLATFSEQGAWPEMRYKTDAALISSQPSAVQNTALREDNATHLRTGPCHL